MNAVPENEKAARLPNDGGGADRSRRFNLRRVRGAGWGDAGVSSVPARKVRYRTVLDLCHLSGRWRRVARAAFKAEAVALSGIISRLIWWPVIGALAVWATVGVLANL